MSDDTHPTCCLLSVSASHNRPRCPTWTEQTTTTPGSLRLLHTFLVHTHEHTHRLLHTFLVRLLSLSISTCVHVYVCVGGGMDPCSLCIHSWCVCVCVCVCSLCTCAHACLLCACACVCACVCVGGVDPSYHYYIPCAFTLFISAQEMRLQRRRLAGQRPRSALLARRVCSPRSPRSLSSLSLTPPLLPPQYPVLASERKVPRSLPLPACPGV
jgi:hypothetical protein